MNEAALVQLRNYKRNIISDFVKGLEGIKNAYLAKPRFDSSVEYVAKKEEISSDPKRLANIKVSKVPDCIALEKEEVKKYCVNPEEDHKGESVEPKEGDHKVEAAESKEPEK